MSEAMQTAAEAAPPKSALWLALRVIDEPGRVFDELRVRPRSLVPILLVVLVMFAVAFGIPSEVLKSTTDRQFAATEQRAPGSIPPEMRERTLARVTSVSGRLLVAGAGVAGSLVSLVLTSGVLMLIFRGVSGTAIRFNDEWAIASHAFLPQTIGAVVTLAAIAMFGDPEFRVSLGFLVSTETSRFLHNFANQITFFGAWNVYLLALGNQIKVRDRSIATPLAIVAGLWLAVSLTGAAVATAFASFTG